MDYNPIGDSRKWQEQQQSGILGYFQGTKVVESDKHFSEYMPDTGFIDRKTLVIVIMIFFEEARTARLVLVSHSY